jgi:tetratricopeptide (TPR) repeat protein
MKFILSVFVALCFFTGIFISGCNTFQTDSSDSYFRDTLNINSLVRKLEEKLNSGSEIRMITLDSILQKADSMRHPDAVARLKFIKGSLLYDLNNYAEALKLFTESADVAEANGLTLVYARNLERLASLNLTMGDDHKALKLYYQALPLFEKVYDKEGIAKVYNILGLYKNSQKLHDSAEMYLLKAMKFNEEIGNKRGLTHNRGNLAYVFEKSGNIQKADSIYRQLLSDLVEEKDSINLPAIYHNVYSLHKRNGNFEGMILALRNAIAVSESTRDTSMLATLYLSAGEWHMQKGLKDSAIIFFEKSRQCATALNDYRNLVSVLNRLIEINRKISNSGKISELYEQLSAGKDSLYSRRIKNNLRTSELQYENLVKTGQIEKEKIKLENLRNQKNWYVVLAIILSLLAAFLIIMITYILKNRQKAFALANERLNSKTLQLENLRKEEEINALKFEKLQEEKQALTAQQLSAAVILQQRNEMLAALSSFMARTVKQDEKPEIKEVTGFLNTIKVQLKNDENNDHFNQRFNQIHPGFFTRLTEKHPELSKTEIRFCAYLKLSFDSNQIAAVLNITSEGVRKTRYRIRKKIGLQPEDSLEDYLNSL